MRAPRYEASGGAAIYEIPRLGWPVLSTLTAGPAHLLLGVSEFAWGVRQRELRDELGKPDLDARVPALLSLNASTSDPARVIRLAEQAVEKEPDLTWILFVNALRVRSDFVRWGEPLAWGEAPLAERLEAWIARLQAFDPDNAAPWLLEAEWIRAHSPGIKAVPQDFKPGSEYFRSLAQQHAWRAVMAKALSKPRYDSYARRRFELERRILGRSATPLRFFLSMASHPQSPTLGNATNYARFAVDVLGADAEAKGRVGEAVAHYEDVVRFGVRVREGSALELESIVGAGIVGIGGRPLVGALGRSGQESRAAAWESVLRAMRLPSEGDPLAGSSHAYWFGLVVHVLAGLVALILPLTLVTVGYVGLGRWLRPQGEGVLRRTATALEGWMAAVLFVCRLGLYVAELPYATNFRHNMSAPGEVRSLEGLITNSVPAYPGHPLAWDLARSRTAIGTTVDAPFRSYAPWELGAALPLLLAEAIRRRRARQH